MTDWTNIVDFNSGDTLPNSTMNALMDDYKALAEQSSGAPFFDYMRYGLYTGDGATSQYISGIGKEVDSVLISESASDTAGWGTWHKMSGGWGTYSVQGSQNVMTTKDDQIIDMGSDGFTVDDAGADAHPNKNGQLYEYIIYTTDHK